MTSTSSHPIINQRYQVQRILGKGGMGITYEALDLQQNTLIALKEISLKNLTSAKQLELLEREIEVLQKLNHPQIPAYLDYFEIETEDNKTFYIVQQLAQGKNLHQWIQEGGRVSEREVKAIAVQILQILDYLHSFNPPIIHRDIKPQNLIYSADKKIYLVDFGAVQNAYYTTFLGGSTTIGTFGYMPLEQANGNAVPTSDLYSLGATLLYLITRRSPEEFCQGLRFQIPNNLNLSEDFTNWLEKLLEPDIDDRFSSAKEALTVLENPPSKKENKKIRMLGMGLFAVTLSSLFLFHQYKWAIGFPAPIEVCQLYQYNSPAQDVPDLDYVEKAKTQLATITINYWESGGRFSPSDFRKCLLWSVENGHESMTKWLVNHGANVNIKNEYGRTLLDSVANAQIAEILINNGADVNIKDKDGLTPLHYAVFSNNFKIVETLINNGANVHINVKDQSIETPLHYAVFGGNSEIVEILIKNGADVNFKDKYGETPLYYAVSERNSEIVEILIKNGADVNIKDNNGKTPLHDTDNDQVAKILIMNGADVHIKDNNGQTPLYSVNDAQVAEILIKNGADVNIKDKDGRTPLDYAKSSINSELVKLLIKNGAKE